MMMMMMMLMMLMQMMIMLICVCMLHQDARVTCYPGAPVSHVFPGQRNAQGHEEHSASAERRIAERMVELEARFEANRKLRGPEHVSKPLPNPNLGAYPYHCGAPDRWD